MNCRQFLQMAVISLCLTIGSAVADDVTPQKPLLPALESFPIWPGAAPGGEKVLAKENWILRNPKAGNPNDTAATHVTQPILMVRRPAKPNGAAVLMIPGGSYERVAVSRAGSDIDWNLANLGVTVFVMTYRLPADGWAAGPETPLQDAQRAIRMIRYRAKDFGIDPQRVGVVGFSAGGHLASWTAAAFAHQSYVPVDEADKLSARPDIAGVFFPVITTRAPYAHAASAKNLLGSDPSEASLKRTSINEIISADMPPTLVAHTINDPVVPTANSLLLFQGLRDKKIPSELHIFEVGGHSMMDGDKDLPWLSLFALFAHRHGIW